MKNIILVFAALVAPAFSSTATSDMIPAGLLAFGNPVPCNLPGYPPCPAKRKTPALPKDGAKTPKQERKNPKPAPDTREPRG